MGSRAAAANGWFVWHLADTDPGGWVTGPAVDAMGGAVTCVGVAADGWSVAHLVDDNCGR